MDELTARLSQSLLGVLLLAPGGLLLVRRLSAVTARPVQSSWPWPVTYPLLMLFWAGALWLQQFPSPLVLVCTGLLLVALGVELHVRRRPSTTRQAIPLQATAAEKAHWTRHPVTLGAAVLLNVLILAGPVRELVRFQSRPIPLSEVTPREETPTALAITPATPEPCACNKPNQPER